MTLRKAMNINLRVLAIFFFVLLYSCTTAEDIQPPVYEIPVFNDSTDIFDQNILAAVYTDYKFPEEFYREDLNGGSIYYENTISTQTSDTKWFEHSTNSYDQALAWSETSAVNSAYYRGLVSERETEKFFEFRRVWEDNRNDIVLSRVHKFSYLDRSMYDRFNPNDTLAILRKSPINSESVIELVEYLWFLEVYKITGFKVLFYRIEETSQSYNYVLFHIKTSYGDWGLCDKISVLRTVFSVDKQTGALVQNSGEVILTLDGECH